MSLLANLNHVIQGEVGDDTYELYYAQLDPFLEELDRREENTLRPAIDTKAIQFLTSKELLDHGFQAKANVKNRLYLKVEDKVYPVAETAFNSIKSRIDIFGKGLLELPDELLRDVLNARIKDIHEVRLIIIDEKIRAIMSASSGGYRVMPTRDVVASMLDGLEAKFESFEFLNAFLSYDILYMKVIFPEKAEVIQDLYGKSHHYIPGVLLRTSDTGHAANEIFPIWQVQNGSAVLGDIEESIRIVHRGRGASVEALKDDLPNIFVRLRDTISLVRKQMEYKVKYPALVIENVSKKFKLGKKDTRQMLERLDLFCFTNPDREVTGYDITQLFLDMARQEPNENKKRRLEVVAGKAFNLNYEKFDKELD